MAPQCRVRMPEPSSSSTTTRSEVSEAAREWRKSSTHYIII